MATPIGVTVGGGGGLGLNDINSFGYSGSGLPADQAMELQRLNRRQQLANLLIQRGLTQPQGQMAGRFYVPPSPVQGLANLTQIAAGVLGNHMVGEREQEMGNERQRKIAEVLAEARRLQTDIPAAPPSNLAPPPQAQPTMPPPQTPQTGMDGMPASAPAAMPPQDPREELARLLADRPQGPLGPNEPQGIPGGQPMPTTMSLGMLATPMEGSNEPTGVDVPPTPQQDPRAQVVNAMVPPQPSPMQGPISPGTPAQPRNPQDFRMFLVEQLANQDPLIRSWASTQLGQMASQDEKRENRDFLRSEHELNRLNDLHKTDARLNEMLIMGSWNNETKEAIAKQQAENRKDIAELTAKLSKEGKIESANIAADAKRDAAQIAADAKRDTMQEKRTDKASISRNNVSMALNSIDNVVGLIDELDQTKGLDRITGIMGSIPNWPGGDAANAQAKLNRLKSMASVQMIQDMRNASTTGGAVGQVTEKEWGYLERAAARLDQAQSLPEFKAGLGEYKRSLQRVRGLLTDAFKQQFGDVPGMEPFPSAPPAPAATPQGGVAPFSDAEKERRYQEWKKSQGQ